MKIYLLSWLESRTCGINQRVSGSSPEGGAKSLDDTVEAFFLSYYIYILFSVELNRYYVGSSSDPWKRHLRHISNSIDKYTGRSKDWDLKTVFSLENKTEAIRIERFIKKQKSRTLIERMCQDDFIGSDNLAKLVDFFTKLIKVIKKMTVYK